MFVCCECCVLSGRGLCDGLITRPEQSYRLWCIVECDLETSRMRRTWPALGRSATGKKKHESHFQYEVHVTVLALNVTFFQQPVSFGFLNKKVCQNFIYSPTGAAGSCLKKQY